MRIVNHATQMDFAILALMDFIEQQKVLALMTAVRETDKDCVQNVIC